MLIAADDALKSGFDPNALYKKSEVENKFKNAIDILSDFAKDFPLKYLTSHPNIGGTVTGEVKMSDKFKSATTTLQALKNDLHSNVKFLSVLSLLNADGTLADGL